MRNKVKIFVIDNCIMDIESSETVQVEIVDLSKTPMFMYDDVVDAEFVIIEDEMLN